MEAECTERIRCQKTPLPVAAPLPGVLIIPADVVAAGAPGLVAAKLPAVQEVGAAQNPSVRATQVLVFVSIYFHLPKTHSGYHFLSHSQMARAKEKWWFAPQHPC